MNDYLPWIALGAVLLALTVFKRLGQIAPTKARELLSTGAKLIDVRTRAEFDAGHLPGAINVPVGDLGSRATSLGPTETPLILYCASGTRSAMARSILKGRGFTQVFNLGAMSRW
jgi:phage shock protein E